MTEFELQEQYCSRCESPNCMRCRAFAAHYESENGDDDVDPAACDYYEDDDINVASLTDRERAIVRALSEQQPQITPKQ